MTALNRNPSLYQEKIQFDAPLIQGFDAILTPEAIDLVARLSRKFELRRQKLLEERAIRQREIDQGIFPDFLKETEPIRSADDWKISSIPNDLQDRRVEITGPSGDAKMVINAFNSGANIYMADFEDAQSPTWQETIQGQINLRDAIERKLIYTSPEGKRYALNDSNIATLIVRPRGWHLLEKHVSIDCKPVSASIFDFALFFFHNARKLIEKGTGPYFYLPKMESHLEARLWNDIFEASEDEFRLPRGTIKATVLIETILAAFEMDEILYELREHIVGLNCGRWDYIFSFIKKFRNNGGFLPNRSQITMDKAFLAAYASLLIKTCHRRGALAIGGMSAFIPVKNNEEANKIAFVQVRADKEREANAGHDGTWVAHPGLVQLARSVFDKAMPRPNQIFNLREDVSVTRDDLLSVPQGQITEEGIRTNIRVGIQYLEAWLRGKGSVPLYNLMEDVATAEICRAQLWQWIHHGAAMSDGGRVSESLVRALAKQELEKLVAQLGEKRFNQDQYLLASELFERMIFSDDFDEFLTTIAYDHLFSLEKGPRKNWRTE